ncbi:ATP-binding cassette domain-containing protein [Caenispirillum bisanense]|uniref:ATP-binding cassette domain-containing protein n=1 Tax=Caenispirillum bisanense TaxID=414052 RepID=UPI0031D06C10
MAPFDTPSPAAALRPADPLLPLRVDGLCFASAGGAPLLSDLRFDLTDAGATVLLGHNGAGKSLLLRLLHGLLTPTAGSIRWHGLSPAEARPRQAMVFQRPVMLRRSVRANVEYALALQGHGRRARRERAMAALAGAGLDHLAERPARVLSGGEQQLVALARARAVQPAVLLLDEPTASLDPVHSLAVERLVAAIAADGIKIIMATHDLGQARRLATDVLFLAAGRLVEHAPAAAFFTCPASAAASAFLRGELAA